jgi:hypothetical protein
MPPGGALQGLLHGDGEALPSPVSLRLAPQSQSSGTGI